ncbi:GNAT family N-acetyltransferase [Belliella marina]|uniref:GNAT family N-acetyltransferase n=1 Tax=Belliella marina TaxID=1644146 RepID=A0ABW4VSI1_9BACT
MKKEYIFKSERLGFRDWTKEDHAEIVDMNADLEVMEHFPKLLTENESVELIGRLQKHYKRYGFTYFATEVLETKELIGFVGLVWQNYQSDFTPAVDIGWRLKKSCWGNGYATEGASRCLDFAFTELGMDKIISTCTEKNSKSENVMKKIGMKKTGVFDHPQLTDYPELGKCICYEINKSTWQQHSEPS